MKISKIIAASAVVLAAAACAPKAQIDGVVEGLGSGDTLTVNVLDVNSLRPVKTVAVAEDGSFKVKLDVDAKDPDIVYLGYKNVLLPSILVLPGETVTLAADTLGKFEVSGSEQNVLLAEYQKEYSRVNAALDALEAKISASKSLSEQRSYAKDYSKELRDHYRYALRYVVTNNKSLTSVQVLNQSIGPFSDVLQRYTDAFQYATICDSLETVYPESRYVKALRKEADKRMNVFNLTQKLQEVKEDGFPELRLPDVTASKVSLREVAESNKLVMLHFWASVDAKNNIFNTSVLKNLYKDFHAKGFEIYAVSLDTDKRAWARAIKDQDLPWVNVCDGLGAASPAVSTYNVMALPTTFLIGGGEIVTESFQNEAQVRAFLSKKLK